MNTDIKTETTLTAIRILAWVIFIGVCIKTGAILYSFFVSLVINSIATQNLYLGLNLSNLYNFDIGHYSALVSLIIFLSGLKAYIFYLIIKIILKINYVHPFSKDVSLLVSGISYVAFGIGIVTLISNNYTEWLVERGVVFPDLQQYLGGGVEFLFFAGVIFFIAQIFKRGIEIQSENELTV